MLYEYYCFYINLLYLILQLPLTYIAQYPSKKLISWSPCNLKISTRVLIQLNYSQNTKYTNDRCLLRPPSIFVFMVGFTDTAAYWEAEVRSWNVVIASKFKIGWIVRHIQYCKLLFCRIFGVKDEFQMSFNICTYLYV